MNNFNKFLAGAGLIGAAWCGKIVYDKYFKGKSEEEIAIMLDNAFEKIFAFIRVVKTSTTILEEVTYKLKNGYVSLSTDNVTEEKIHTLYSLVEDIKVLTNDAQEVREPLEIISGGVHRLECNIQKKNQV